MYRKFGKRLFDILASAAGLIVLCPLLLVLYMLVVLFLGRPALYRQARPGRDGELFRIAKFRTMTDERNSDGELLPDSERLVRFGKFLRSTSLDELPELVNVLKGDMSLIGPRPLLEEYLSRYSPEQARRHEVRPGLTGWAQINGRNTVSWEERLTMDVWYVGNVSFRLDMKILFLTVWKTIRREGISAPGEATMTKFQGTTKKASSNASEECG